MQIVPRLRSANLNLVPILRALLREVSVTKAAATLALSPSATSCALADLRVLLNDPLLVRTGRTMRLTPRAEQIAGKLEFACLALEDLLRETNFDPATAQRTFIVAAPDYVGILIGPPLIKRLRDEAPGVRIRFVDVPADLERGLALGAIDLGFVAINHLDWLGLSTGESCHDRLVGMVDARHPLAAVERPDRAAVERYPVADWLPGLDLSTRATRSQSALTRDIGTVQLASQSIAGLPISALGTDLVAILPGIFARHLSTVMNLRVVELPYAPVAIDTAPLWSAVQDADPAHRWFRDLAIAEMVRAHA